MAGYFQQGGFAGFLRAAPGRGSILAWTETALVMAMFMALCFWLRPWDPFFLASLFPWTWLAPVLLALRHGSKSAVLSALLLMAAWLMTRNLFFPTHGLFPKGYFLGGFITSLCCGEFRDLWLAELLRERKSKDHLEHRFVSLSRSHQVLSQSHERLQVSLLNHPPTLRDALEELRGISVGLLNPETAQSFLTLLARFFQLEMGSLHLVDQGLRPEPLAFLGPAHELRIEDALVKSCLETGKLCHVLENEEASVAGRYLFALPLQTGDGEILAVLVAEKMAFFAFHEENLQALSAVCGYFADMAAASNSSARVTDKIPNCPPDFAAEYLRLHRLGVEYGLESALAATLLPVDASLSAQQIMDAGRSLDLFWNLEIPGAGKALVVLLPFCGESSARVFLTRLEAKIGRPPSAHDVALLGHREPLAELESFLQALPGTGVEAHV